MRDGRKGGNETLITELKKFCEKLFRWVKPENREEWQNQTVAYSRYIRSRWVVLETVGLTLKLQLKVVKEERIERIETKIQLLHGR